MASLNAGNTIYPMSVSVMCYATIGQKKVSLYGYIRSQIHAN